MNQHFFKGGHHSYIFLKVGIIVMNQHFFLSLIFCSGFYVNMFIYTSEEKESLLHSNLLISSHIRSHFFDFLRKLFGARFQFAVKINIF